MQTVSTTEGEYLSQEKHKVQKVKLETPAGHGQYAMNMWVESYVIRISDGRPADNVKHP